MGKDEIRLQELAHKWLTGKLDLKEEQEFKEWLDLDGEQVTEIPEELAISERVHQESLFSKIEQAIAGEPAPRRILPERMSLLWVASILLIIVPTAFLIYRYVGVPFSNEMTKNLEDIAPGGNKAFLTLGNGKKICLTDIANGSVVKQDGVQIKKMGDGRLVYSVEDRGEKKEQQNTIETPKGGQYQVILPDGSLVWLNAASKLSYQTALNEKGKRIVSLEGEAYFEIQEDKRHPFIVQMDGQQVEVLGTHFNINNYADHHRVETTLLSGSVRVSAARESVILKPGQQALSDAMVQVSTCENIEQVIAWKNGQFSFRDAGIPEVMKQVERWYDVEVRYEGKLPAAEFNGKMPRNLPLSKFLEMLAYTGVKFETEGKTIRVKAYQ